VINAIEEAQKLNVTTIGFTGFDGGRLGQIVNINILVQSNIIEHVEDIHLMLEHIIIKMIKEEIQAVSKTTTALSQLPATLFSD
jgi:D-sedoheptulose 7-phosphate isomerase